MILHLVTKHRVSNGHLSVFEKNRLGQNIVLVIDTQAGPVPSVNNGIEVNNNNSAEIVKAIDFNSVNQIVIHYLTPKIAHFVQKYVPEGIPIYWWTYGGDLYQPCLERRGYDLFYYDLTPFRPGWRYMVYRFFETKKVRLEYKLGILHGSYMQSQLMNRIVGIIPCIPPDHSLACKYINKNFKLIRIYQRVARPTEDVFQNGNGVAIGHSASYSDNHLYALKYLSKIDIKDSEVSLTLSYNVNSNVYLDMIKKRFKSRFKDKVTFIEDILSKEEWSESQNKLKIMILPTWRQEALANVYSAFWRGVKLFLSKKGPMYDYFLDYGFKVFAIEDMNQHLFDMPLTEDEKLHNRNLMNRYREEGNTLESVNFDYYF